jgi:hypothetical protein
VTGWRICRPVNGNMGMICGAFKRLWNPLQPRRSGAVLASKIDPLAAIG